MTDFETRLKESLQSGTTSPNADTFVADLHSERKNRHSAKVQFLNGIIAGALVVSLGIFTASQLGTNPEELMVYDSFEMMSEDERAEEEFLTELAVYYLEKSEDMWGTLAFLEDTDFFTVMLEEL